jgi:hypothetical protein
MVEVAVRVESADMETRLVGRQRRRDQRLVRQPTEPLGKVDTRWQIVGQSGSNRNPSTCVLV